MLKVIVLATLTAAVAQGTPLLLTALGEILTQRSGVLNLGLEGMMLMGAASAFIALIHTDSLLIAVLAGALCSGLLALLHAFLSVTCRVHQIICGLALNIFAGGLNFHGRYEFVPIQNMEKAMNVIVKIAELVASK